MSRENDKMLKRIIAVCGGKGSGKDEIGAILEREFSYNRIKLASPLKDAIKALYGFDDHEIEDRDLKEAIDGRWGISPRSAMQFFGTEVMQFYVQELMPGIGRKFFVKRLISNISRDTKRYVITDMRFPHEAIELKKAFPGEMFIIRIDRPSLVEDSAHCSEVEYRDIQADVVINNDATLEDLKSAVVNLL